MFREWNCAYNLESVSYKVGLKDVEVMEYEVTEHKGEKCIVRIHKPILTAEEKKAKVDDAKKAVVRFYKESRSK